MKNLTIKTLAKNTATALGVVTASVALSAITITSTITLAHAMTPQVSDIDVIGLRNDEPVEYGQWAEDFRQILTAGYERTNFDAKTIRDEAKFVSCGALNRFKSEIGKMYWVKQDPYYAEDIIKELNKLNKSCKKNNF